MDDLSHDLPPSTLLNDLHSFVNNKELSDVTFVLEGQSIYAHKMMLVRYVKGKLSMSHFNILYSFHQPTIRLFTSCSKVTIFPNHVFRQYDGIKAN